MNSVAKVFSASPLGFEGFEVEVESDAANGLPSLQIVGLGNKAIDEARERVRSAITNSGFQYPTKRIIVNLAPAEMPKDGTHFDLPIALAILINSGAIQQSEVSEATFAGELALDGSLRAVKGIIAIIETAKKRGRTTAYIPEANVSQARLVPGILIVGVPTLRDLYLHLKKENTIQATQHNRSSLRTRRPSASPILDDIYDQEKAKRALIIAAAGRHNILLNGPPGSGKTMLARTLPSLLPALSAEEMIAVTKLHSLAGEATDHIITERPFRSPHHTSSRIALIGGGTKPRPGEISLAHYGVLFLDEIPEYPRSTLESLRQPLEDKQINVSRANGHVTYPANFMLVATMNPCPCGFFGDTTKECSCSLNQITTYQKKLSGPLMDRIDIVLNVSRVSNDHLLMSRTTSDKQHKSALNLINTALERQSLRYKSSSKYNSDLTSSDLKKNDRLSEEARVLLKTAIDRLNLSARSYFKVIKIAQTIADITSEPLVSQSHISEALQYRQAS